MKPGDLFRTQARKSLHRNPTSGLRHIFLDIPWNTTGIILEVQTSWIRVLIPSGINGWCTNMNIKVLNETR